MVRAVDAHLHAFAIHSLIIVAKDLLNFDKCLDPAGRCFGPFRVLLSQVFYESALSFALVNLKPIVPGLCP
jgi:hypothetical protein